MTKRHAVERLCPQMRRTATAALIAWAGIGGAAVASCRMPGTQVGAAVMAQYLAEPKSLISGFPQGGYGLQATVGQMSASGAKGVDAVMQAASNGSEPQRKAIGRGLGDAANQCQKQDGTIALRVTNAAMSSGNAAVKRAFVAVVDPDSAAPSLTNTAVTAAAPLPDDLTLPKISASQIPLADPFGTFEQWH